MRLNFISHNNSIMSFITADPTPFTAIAEALGEFFKLGQDLSTSFNSWADKVLIPGAQRASVQARLRQSKWKLNHFKHVKIVDEVYIRFPDQSDEMRAHIIELLKGETGRSE